jgi:hypothetical protein
VPESLVMGGIDERLRPRAFNKYHHLTVCLHIITGAAKVLHIASFGFALTPSWTSCQDVWHRHSLVSFISHLLPLRG